MSSGSAVLKSEETERDGCCQKNRLSICLALLLAVAVMFLAGTFLGWKGFYTDEDVLICSETECIKASAELESYVNQSIDPCEDFYAFVCGKFIETAYENQISNLLKAEQQKVQHQLDALIINPISETDIKPVRMQKKFFQTCLKEDAMDADQERTFFSLMDQIGGWPLLNRRTWREHDFNWMKVMINAKQQGMPFDWFLKIDLFEGSQYDLKITRPSNCDAINQYPTDEYVSLIATIISILTEPTMNSFSEITDIVNFEKEFAKICERSKNSKVSVNTLVDLENRWFKNGIDCLPFIRSITGQGTHWQLNSQVAFDDYIIRLDHLLQKTSKQVQAGYILWKITEYFAPYLSRPIREAYKHYTEKLSGESMNRFEFCLKETKRRFPFVSETVNIRNFALNVEEDEEQLVQSIKQEVVTRIDNADWQNNSTKQANLEFFTDLEEIIGGVELMFEDRIFSHHLHIGQLSFSSWNIINTIVELTKTSFFSKMKMIGEDVREATLSFAFEANSNHEISLHLENEQLYVPAAMFNSFSYNPSYPKYLNYAGLGSSVAYELVNGLITLNRNLNSSKIESKHNKKCLLRSQTTNNEELDPSLLLETNYAFILGQDIAYKAYQKWVGENGEEPLLVGLEFTPNQLFWIKSNLHLCYHKLPEEDNTDPNLELVMKYGIIEVVKNSEFFAEDFKCPINKPMNPEIKCHIF